MRGAQRYVVLATTILIGGDAAAEKSPRLDTDLLVPYFQTGAGARAAEAYRLQRWQEAATLFEGAEKKLPRTSNEREPARFLRAMALLAGGAYDDAATLFAALVTSYPLLADHHAYQAARSHLLAGRPEQTLIWTASVGADSVLRGEATLLDLESLERLERWQALADQATAYLDVGSNGIRRAEARYRQALAFEKLNHPAHETVPLYRRIWALAPTEKWATLAEGRMNALLEAADPAEVRAVRAPGAREWHEHAMALADKQRNVEAEHAFASALADQTRDPALACEATFHRAQAIFKQRNRPRAAPVFEQAEMACRAAGNEDLLVKALYQGARCQASQGQEQKALQKYADLEKDFPAHSYADDARVRTAELHTEHGRMTDAQATLAEVPARYPTGDMLGEALFRLAFAAYQARAHDEAHRWLDENLRLVPRETMWFAEGRALYWKARMFELARQREKSLTFYERTIREYPLSIYALLAFERLRTLAPKLRENLLVELRRDLDATGTPVDFGRHPAYRQHAFLRGVELARMGLGDEARRELARVDWKADAPADDKSSETPMQERALWLTSVLLDRGRVWDAAHAVPRYTLKDWKPAYPQDRNAIKWRLAYPRAYPEYVTAHSRKNGVPWALQLAIMREESAFNPTIESFANAMGLTQMLVSTAQRFSTTPVGRETLLDPEQNITLGSRFLGFLLQHYNGVIPTSIPGYNAGEAAVDRWLAERGNLPLDEFLETIPCDETRGYTKRVLATYFTYNWLYNPKSPIPRLDFSLKKAQRGAQAKSKK